LLTPFLHRRSVIVSVRLMAFTHRQETEIQLNKEASVKTNVFVALLFALTLTAGTAAAQPAPFNQIGVTMGHWHIASKDREANKKLFLAMGGKVFMPGGNPLIMFPGVYINLNL